LWLLSTIATLAERPSLIERLFITKEINNFGVYRVKLCKNGEWVTITLDDFFPCYPMGSPIFSRNAGNDIWVLLLEKAYAKLHGNYFALRSGSTTEAMIDFTGCPTDRIVFKDAKITEMAKNGSLWDLMKQADEEGYLMNAFVDPALG
jgi:calpain-15